MLLTSSVRSLWCLAACRTPITLFPSSEITDFPANHGFVAADRDGVLRVMVGYNDRTGSGFSTFWQQTSSEAFPVESIAELYTLDVEGDGDTDFVAVSDVFATLFVNNGTAFNAEVTLDVLGCT